MTSRMKTFSALLALCEGISLTKTSDAELYLLRCAPEQTTEKFWSRDMAAMLSDRSEVWQARQYRWGDRQISEQYDNSYTQFHGFENYCWVNRRLYATGDPRVFNLTVEQYHKFRETHSYICCPAPNVIAAVHECRISIGTGPSSHQNEWCYSVSFN